MKALKLLLICGAIAGIVLVFFEWLAANRDATALKQTIAAQSKILDSASSDKRKNDLDLKKALAQIESLKRKVKAPSEAVRGLNELLPLPEPITFTSDEGRAPASLRPLPRDAGESASRTASDSPAPKNASQGAGSAAPRNVATVPAADLVPIYDYALDCRACTTQLEAARRNALDDAAKIQALQAERDAAIKSSHGGNFTRRLKVAAVWFVIGAGAAVAVSGAAPRHR
jgi:hypothetical protein